MIQYKIYFLNGDVLVISEQEFMGLSNRVHATNADGTTQSVDRPFYSVTTPKRTIAIRMENINYIESENVESESNVITPPTPQQLRSEKEIAHANQDVTLDAQLSNPEVAK